MIFVTFKTLSMTLWKHICDRIRCHHFTIPTEVYSSMAVTHPRFSPFPSPLPLSGVFCICYQLAPRDVVSRTILSEMRLQKASHMFLDISHRPADWIRDRFPSIHQHCLQVGFDMTSQPLPVVPAAHYFCGGVDTDLVGRTTLSGLFAAGEICCLRRFSALNSSIRRLHG